MKLFIVILSWLAFGTAGAEPPNLRHVRQMLEREETIRLYVNYSPGMGHQSALAHTLHRLRDLGARGTIEVVWGSLNYILPGFEPEMRQKMSILFPGFDEYGGAVQNVPALGITYIDYRAFRRSAPRRVRLGLIAATDNRVFASDLAADVLVTIQPLGWDKPWSIEVENGFEEDDVDINHLKRHGHTYDWERVPESLVRKAGNKNREPIALSALRRLYERRHELDTAVFYGHGLMEDETGQLAKYIAALSEAQREYPADFGRPTVVLVVHDEYIRLVDLKDMAARKPLAGRPVKVMALEDPDFKRAVSRLKPGRILIAQSPRMPPDLFHYFLANGTLVAVAGGRNSMNLLGQVGRPYLPSNDYESFHFLQTHVFPEERRATPAWADTFDARQALLGDVTKRKIDQLKIFMRAAKDSDSAVSKFFHHGRLQDTPESDVLVKVLLEARRYVLRTRWKSRRDCDADLTRAPVVVGAAAS